MLLQVFRAFGKKIRIPAGNSKTTLNVMLPERRVLETAEFTQISQEFFYKAKKALEDVKEANPEGKLDIGPSSIRFEKPDFVLNIERDFGEQSLQVLIGDGITHSYFFDRESERWVSSTDGHLLEELLGREITKKCLGYFNI